MTRIFFFKQCRHTKGHFHENLENGLNFYSLNFNGILHVFDKT